MQVVKGMVQIDGATYRIARVLPHIYEVVRILDNRVAGWFTSVAHEAVKQGKTSWVGRTGPVAESQPERSEVSGVRAVETLAPASADDVMVVLRARNGR